jgi:ADP-ribosylglycohydrolase
LEAAVTNAEDGVWAAQAVAASVSVACAGGSVDEVVSAAGTALPGESWIQRMVESAVATANHADSLLAVVPKLSNEIINKEYSYGAVAPETLALTLAILKITGRDFDSALMGSLAFAKTADSVPALVGALAGALSGVEIDFQPWEKSIRYLKGICLPNSKGKDFIKLTEQLADLADRKFSKMKT